MKKLLLTTATLIAFLFFNETKAQVRLNVNINVGTRPAWGVPGNVAGDYYYLPEIDTYYDIPHRQFIYLEGGNWRFSYTLPVAYRNYDLNRGYKVVINEPRPYLHYNVYRAKYSRYYNTYREPVNHDRRFDNAYRPGDRDDRRHDNGHWDNHGHRGRG